MALKIEVEFGRMDDVSIDHSSSRTITATVSFIDREKSGVVTWVSTRMKFGR